MSGPLVGLVLTLIAQIALTLWVGGILFFSFVTTPVLFRTLDRHDAARALRALFPLYYRMGAACGAVAVVAGAARALLAPEPRARGGVFVILGAAMLGLTLYAWRVLLPLIERARVRAEGKDPTDPTNLEQRYFKRLHAQSVRINGMVLLLGVVCLVMTMIPR
ncbi:MAG TPA: DUF4149 domain-containing protein [Candidatus Polarisedimenticolia bacterium]|nr:DUF4149 domain-containing protein [Candidatus Polarisedimenticolia bacterium]